MQGFTGVLVDLAALELPIGQGQPPVEPSGNDSLLPGHSLRGLGLALGGHRAYATAALGRPIERRAARVVGSARAPRGGAVACTNRLGICDRSQPRRTRVWTRSSTCCL